MGIIPAKVVLRIKRHGCESLTTVCNVIETQERSLASAKPTLKMGLDVGKLTFLRGKCTSVQKDTMLKSKSWPSSFTAEKFKVSLKTSVSEAWRRKPASLGTQGG